MMLMNEGPKNPKVKDHTNDSWIDIAREAALSATGDQTGSHSVVAYTARGHGASVGWEMTAAADPEQFTWSRLATDMNEVAKHCFPEKPYVCGGSSMGSATALWNAIHHPTLVRGVIMIRPPTAWEERAARRKNILSCARKLEAANASNGELFHLVLRGTAYSDLPLPAVSGEEDMYGRIACPVLILTVEGDESHPVYTAQVLHERIPVSTLHVAADPDEAKATWPGFIQEFLKNL
jgi:3-oxoadipate enol-lactonase